MCATDRPRPFSSGRHCALGDRASCNMRIFDWRPRTVRSALRRSARPYGRAWQYDHPPCACWLAWKGASCVGATIATATARESQPAIPQANAGFGLWLGARGNICLGHTNSDLVAVPGDLYGPTSRLVFRVDQELADRVRSCCGVLQEAQLAPPLDESMLDTLLAITHELGLAAPILPPATGQEENSCIRPAQFIRRLLLAQPLPSVHAA
jgi:hypothetical protein